MSKCRLPAAATAFASIGLLLLAGGSEPDDCEVTLRLVDAESGREIAGLVRLTDEQGRSVAAAQLISRGVGLSERLPIVRWSVLPEKRVLRLPRRVLTIEAFCGLETEAARRRVDLRDRASAEVTIRLKRFYDASERGFLSGNTHLHLQKLSREESDRYLRAVPRGDDLDLLFVSYLERAGADADYITNGYTAGDLAALERGSPVRFGNGEEHRHNFTGFGEGYGHVMFLNIKRLIQPVSIGPGIMKTGTDGLPLQRGIDAARRDGAAVIWCHNGWGMEDVPNLLAGRLDAVNIFDGGVHGSFKDSFYRYLNAGLRVPFSTGTDWFLYDFSRVYCRVKGDFSVQSWLEALAAGRSYITNGPLLEFSVAGEGLGETVDLARASSVPVTARARGRVEFGRIELVRNGRVIAKAASRRVGGHHEAGLSLELKIDSPCWLALRTPPPPVDGDAELSEPVARNELGRDLFAHTSPIYVRVGGREHFDEPTARRLLAEMQSARRRIAKTARFADEQERARVLDVYTDGIAQMERRLQTQ